MAANVSKVRRLYQKNKVTAYGNMDFHVLLAMATENPMFIILLKTLRAGFNLIIPPKNQIQIATIAHHEKILQAIKDGDPEAAAKEMSTHLLEMGDLFATDKVPFETQEKSETRSPFIRTKIGTIPKIHRRPT